MSAPSNWNAHMKLVGDKQLIDPPTGRARYVGASSENYNSAARIVVHFHFPISLPGEWTLTSARFPSCVSLYVRSTIKDCTNSLACSNKLQVNASHDVQFPSLFKLKGCATQ